MSFIIESKDAPDVVVDRSNVVVDCVGSVDSVGSSVDGPIGPIGPMGLTDPIGQLGESVRRGGGERGGRCRGGEGAQRRGGLAGVLEGVPRRQRVAVPALLRLTVSHHHNHRLRGCTRCTRHTTHHTIRHTTRHTTHRTTHHTIRHTIRHTTHRTSYTTHHITH